MAAVASSAPGDPPTETGSIAADTALVLPAAASPVASPGASTAVAPDAAAPAAAATAPDAAVAGAGALPAEESALPPATAASDSSHGSLLPFIPLLGVGMFLALTGGGNGSDLGLPPDVGGTPPAGSPPGGGPPPIITPPIVPPVTTTPEPATMVLIASGLGALGAARTRRRGK
jgi:hypothetical protein